MDPLPTTISSPLISPGRGDANLNAEVTDKTYSIGRRIIEGFSLIIANLLTLGLINIFASVRREYAPVFFNRCQTTSKIAPSQPAAIPGKKVLKFLPPGEREDILNSNRIDREKLPSINQMRVVENTLIYSYASEGGTFQCGKGVTF